MAATIDAAQFEDWARPSLLARTRLAKRLAPHADADDIVQDSLTRAWLKRAQFDAARGTATTWLLAIVADQARAARRTRIRRLRVVDDHTPPPDQPAAESSPDLDLGRAIAGLAARQQLAVQLHYFVGLTVDETAAVMSCSPGTVKSTLFDALTFGCGAVGGMAQVGAGTLLTTGIPNGPAAGCTGAQGDQSATVDSFLASNPVRWSIRNGRLLIYGGGAQAYSLVFSGGPATPPPTIASATPVTAASLVGKRWRLTSASVETSSATSASGSGHLTSTQVVLTFDGHDGFRLTERCGDEAGTVTLSRDQAAFAGRHQTNSHSCPYPGADEVAGETHDLHLVDTVFDGTAQLTVDGDEVTLTRGGATLTFGA